MKTRTIKNIHARSITFCQNGEIKIGGYLVIGTWKNLQPKKTMREKGFKGTRYLSYVENFYEAYLLGVTLGDYTRKELKEQISRYSFRKGIELIDK